MSGDGRKESDGHRHQVGKGSDGHRHGEKLTTLKEELSAKAEKAQFGTHVHASLCSTIHLCTPTVISSVSQLFSSLHCTILCIPNESGKT